MITVKELIEVLQLHDPEAVALVGWEYAGFLLVTPASINYSGNCLNGRKFMRPVDVDDSLRDWYDKWGDQTVPAVVIGGEQIDRELL